MGVGLYKYVFERYISNKYLYIHTIHTTTSLDKQTDKIAIQDIKNIYFLFKLLFIIIQLSIVLTS